MSGRQFQCTQTQRLVEQYMEAHVQIAVEARIGRAARSVLCDKAVHDQPLERVRHIDQVKRDAKLIRNATGQRGIFRRASNDSTGCGSALFVERGCLSLAPQPQHDADDFIPLFYQQRGSDRAVHAAGHGDDDSCQRLTSAITVTRQTSN
jgi:hypothetical protein